MTPPVVRWLLLASLVASCDGAAPCGLQLCDVRSPSCQTRVAAATACLRGKPVPSVPVRVVDRASYLADAEAGVSLPGAQTAVAFGRWNTALSLLGLSFSSLTQTGAALRRASRVAASYEGPRVGITLVDDGSLGDSLSSVALLVHEYVHAVADEQHDLTAFENSFAETTDADLAAHAVIEGDAMQVQDLARLGLFRSSPDRVAWDRVLAAWQTADRDGSAESSTPALLAWSYFPYSSGAGLANGRWREAGWPAVDATYVAAPRSTRAVIAERHGPLVGGPPVLDALLGDDAVPVPGPAWSAADSDALGAWMVGTFLDRAPARAVADAAMAHLQGDVFSIHVHGPTQGLLAAWRMRFASAEVAQMVAATVARKPRTATEWAVVTRDGDVIVLAADKAGALPDDFQAMSWTARPPHNPGDGLAGGRQGVHCARPRGL